MLIIRGIEVSQGIQYFRADQHLTDPADRGPDNSLTLVADKVAWARVYVESDGDTAIPGVTGTLQVGYGIMNATSGPPLLIDPEPPGTVTAQVAPDYPTTRGSTTMTLNFIIPAERMSGPLVLTAEVTGGGQTATSSVHISATLRQTLRVRGILIGYNGPNPSNPSSTLTVAAPGLAELQTTAAWALRIMPVQANGVFEAASTMTRTVALTGTATNGGCTTAWLNLNAAIATAKTADGNHPGFLYYGLLAATFPNTSNNGGCESSGVSSGFSGGQVAMAHEIGHACGRAHAPCGGVGTSADPNYPAYEPYDSPSARVASIGEYGLDITNGAVPTPASARDYMSYCGPGWISIYGHQALSNNDNLNPEQVGVRRPWWKDYVAYDPWWWLHYIPDPPPYWIDPADIVENPVDMRSVISVIGVLHADDRVEILSITRTAVMNAEVAGTATPLRAVLHGATKGKATNELASAPVVALPSRGTCGCSGGAAPGDCGCGGGHPSGPRLFQAMIPDVAAGTALSLQRGDEVVWKRTAPKTRPTVGEPKIQRRREDEGKVEVTWTVRGKNIADTWVRVSADDGRTWRVVATGLSERRAVIEASHLPVGKLLLQVVAHDGFHSVTSKAARFESATAAPVPAILHPHPGRHLVAGSTLYLWGSAATQPGGTKEHFRFKWTVDGKAVGDGLQSFARVPSPGPHRCELTVQDAKGQRIASAKVEFTSVGADERTA